MQPTRTHPPQILALRILMAAFLMGLTAMTSGCTVPVHAQRLLARPNMQFTGSTIFGTQPRLLPQIESGAATSGGGQAAGCSSCR